ncbi:hypothetical protein SBRCBS47491_008090 [Sporothrix bragantina]|uniref:Uncharacterized protein n=1 Tax=Sporothrix bragantina TaxID=671064 RepID=A0ABP0CJY0_9PEZI
MSQTQFTFTPYTGLDREGALRLVNDIKYKPSPEEVAVMEQREAEYQAAKAAKAARKAEKAQRRKDEKAMRSNKQYKNTNAYTYTYEPSSTMEDGASVFSARSSTSYSSFRKLLSKKSHDKTAR